MEPIVIEKANQFVSFRFGDVELLDIMNFLGGATSLDSFLKAYKTAEIKGFFPYEWFDCPQKLNNGELPPYDAFFSKLRNVLAFYHKKRIDMLKLGCTLPNLANICLHKYTSAKFYPFTETDKDLLQKIREDMVGGPSIVFTRKAVVDETFIRKSEKNCKSIVGIDASQLYPYSMCQPMPTGLYPRWDYDTESNRFKPQQNKSRNFENMVMLYFQRHRPDCEIDSFYTTGTQKKIDCLKVDGFCAHCNTVFEAMGCFYHYCPCQEARPSLIEEDIKRGNKK